MGDLHILQSRLHPGFVNFTFAKNECSQTAAVPMALPAHTSGCTAVAAQAPLPAAPLSGCQTATGSSVASAIAAMAVAVQHGDFAGAEAVGATAAVHLALPKYALLNLRPLSDGAQAAVFVADLAPDCAHLLAGLEPDSVGAKGLVVAVKRAHIRDSADLDRFRREAALLAELRHPHIVRLLGARLLPPGYQLVLQLEASNAASELHQAGWRPPLCCQLRLGAQLAAALAHMHAAGYVHRDIKPANVLLNATRGAARLADLGLAAPAAELVAGGGTHAKPTGGFHKQHMVGTLEYMAPEVLLKEAHSPAADVFALAVTLNELATGVVPYSDCTRDNPLAHTVLEMGYGRQELAAAVASEGLRPTLAGGTPPALVALLQACWARQPARRPTAHELAAALERLAAEAEAGAEAELEALPGVVKDAVEAAASSGSGLPAAELAAGCDADMANAAEPTAETAPCSAASVAAVAPAVAAAGAAAGAAAAADGNVSASLPRWLAAGSSSAAAKQLAATPTVYSGMYLTAGRRDKMEDYVTVLHDAFGTAGAPGCTVLGVFDGHRGASAAEFLLRSLRQLLAARLHGSGSSGELLAGALRDADVAYRAQQDAAWAERLARMGAAAGGNRPAPGSTATVLLTYCGWPQQQQGEQRQQEGGQQVHPQQMLAVANLGDSRAVLCRGGQPLQLTRDHTGNLADERRRVAAAGGSCSMRAGSWRLGSAGLQVTRSVGDADLKDQGVSAEAEVAELALTPQDSFLIAATDGLWDRVSNEDAVALVQDTVKHPGMCAQRLVLEALARGSGDNVAVVVAFLNCAGNTVERVYSHGLFKYGGAVAVAARCKAATAVVPSADELRDTD